MTTTTTHPSQERFVIGGDGSLAALEEFEEQLACTHARCTIARAQGSTAFHSAITRTHFGDLALVDLAVSPLRVRRDHHVASADDDVVGVQVVLDGVERIGRDPSAPLLSPGEVLVWDSTRTIDVEALQPLRKRTLILPGERARQLLPQIDTLAGRPLPAGLAAVRLLRSFLATLAQQLPDLDAPGREAAARATYELLRGVLAPAIPTPDAALRLQVEAYIEHHLANERLSPTVIAREHAVSVRRLHALYHGRETVSARIRRRRLERCKEDLQNSPGVTVTEIAFRWGFRNAGHFSTAFGQHFGHAPSDLRRARAAD